MSLLDLKYEPVIAHCVKQTNDIMSINKLTYPNIYIPNRGLAWTLFSKSENDEMVLRVKRDVDEYNQYVDALLAIDSFEKEFCDNGYYLSRNDCVAQFGEQNTDVIFSLKRYQFQPDLCVNDKWIFLRYAKWKYCVEVFGCKIEFETEPTDEGYPFLLDLGEKQYDILWNWYSDERDFCFYFWNKSTSNGWIIQANDDNGPQKSYDQYEFYDQTRDEIAGPDKNIMRVFKLLQSLGFLSLYSIVPEKENPVWQLRSAQNGTIGMMLIDTNWEKNPQILEKVRLLLNAAEDDEVIG